MEALSYVAPAVLSERNPPAVLTVLAVSWVEEPSAWGNCFIAGSCLSPHCSTQAVAKTRDNSRYQRLTKLMTDEID